MKFPTIIDRYIIKKFLITFLFSISLLAIIIIIFDLSEKINDFLEREAPIKAIVFDYYCNFLPYLINMFSYLFIFIAVIFFTSKMAARTEIIAILNGGISFSRFLVPYIVTAIFLGLISFALSNFIIPRTYVKVREFEKIYWKNSYENNEINIHMQIKKNVFVYTESFQVSNNIGIKFAMEKFNNNEEIYKLAANKITWIDSTQQWRLNNYYERTFDGTKETLRQGMQLDTTLGFSPAEFIVDVEDKKIMDYWELNAFIDKERLKGSSNIRTYEVEKWRRICSPLASIILTLIGVSLSSRKVRGGIGANLGIGIALAFSYILFIQITEMLSRYGGLTPLVAVMIPNIFYGIIAIFLLIKAKR
ncbi:MAG: LptF/LptG family permease [Bacteroidales bacterium]|nr:LptF/LptG family permease [Bacteroidales bacterium]